MRTAPAILALGLLAASCSGDDSLETTTDAGPTGTDEAADVATDETPADASSAEPTTGATDDEPAAAEEQSMSSTTSEPPADGETTPTSEPPTTSLQLNPTTTKAAPTTTAGAPAGSSQAQFAGSIEPALAAFVEMAKADLAGRLGIESADIGEASSVLVTWPDTAIGCPLSGMEYLQVPQDGSLIELEVAGTFYRYHSGGDHTAPFLCPASRATAPAGT